MTQNCEIIDKTTKLVKKACRRESNRFGYGIWKHHILLVVENARFLADRLGADREVVELSALLHDYSSVIDAEMYPEHHLHSARLAGEILSGFGYPKEKIGRVKDCICSHRDRNVRRVDVEVQILASADAMAHFQAVNSLLYLAFVKHGLGIEEGTEWVLEKLDRSWSKMIPEAKEIIRERHDGIRHSLRRHIIGNLAV